MCDYSLESYQTRDAVVGDQLITTHFGTGTTGFSGVKNRMIPVCVKPGTELAFDKPVEIKPWTETNTGLLVVLFKRMTGGYRPIKEKTATFRTLPIKGNKFCHRDCLEFPSGRIVKLHALQSRQTATVLQMPVTEKSVEVTAEEAIKRYGQPEAIVRTATAADVVI